MAIVLLAFHPSLRVLKLSLPLVGDVMMILLGGPEAQEVP